MAAMPKKTNGTPETEEVSTHNTPSAFSRDDHGLEIVILINGVGIVTYVSPSITALLHHAPEAIVGRPAQVLIHPDDLTSIVSTHDGTSRSQAGIEYRLLHEDGSWRWFKGQISNLLQVPGVEAIVLALRPMAASELVSPHSGEATASWHFVQFYHNEFFLLDSVCEFIRAGLQSGDACIVVMTQAHQELLEEQLRASGLDLAAARAANQFLVLNAVDTLARCMQDGVPDTASFMTLLGDTIKGVAEKRQHVRIFGEMVEVLCEQGKHAAAIRLEELWNELHQRLPVFSLFCAYSMQAFAHSAYSDPFAEICQQHSSVIPVESYSTLSSRDAQQRAIAVLQQKAHSLEAEREERQHFVSLVEHSKDFISIVDADQHVHFLNQMGQQLVGLYGDEEVQQTMLFDYFPPEEQGRVANDIFPLLLQNGSWDGEVVFRHFQTGKHIPVLWNIFLLRHEKTGKIQHYACIAHDIRERKQRERELARMAAIVAFSNDAIIGKTLAGEITSWNQAAERMYGYTAAEVVGKHITTIFPQDRLGEFGEFVARLTRGERIERYQTQRVRKDGHRIDVSITISPIMTARGEIIGASTISREITDQVQADKRKNDFINLTSHELKTPITSLKGFIHVLRRRLMAHKDETSLYYLSRADAQLNRLGTLVNELLDISKMQSGELELREEVIDLDALVQEILENVQLTTQNHHLSIEGSSTASVSGDRDRLGQVLTNLLINAIKYSPQTGTIIVHLSRDEEHALISVQDFGIGIDQVYHQKIFERFYQVEEPAGSTYPGLGIGLYISRDIIERHHGKIWVESRKGAGTTFFVSLPLL